uniref:helix-turn-helix transcriptional regulator n=1 Tax=Ningiella ruwaisensis TaxID=2364274 RepID=UPI00109F8845|nr:response regulator transcription factor [Ningiella ruwaisensis]
MPSKNVFVASKYLKNITARSHTKVTHLLDLIDACGYEVKIGSELPSVEYLKTHRLVFIGVDLCDSSMIFDMPVMRHTHELPVALFNTQHDEELELKAFKNGLKGILCLDDTLENQIKGIQALNKGRKWYRREIVEHLAQEYVNSLRLNSQDVEPSFSANLTRREKLITSMIADGAQNQEIANQLHISVNTVKTHVYSIFRKTHSRNRAELIKWHMRQLQTA